MQARLIGTLLACAGACCCLCAPAAAQGSYSPYEESASSALARYVRTLASDPKDFSALIGAGRAALATGDAQAAAGFFARADEINPRSPLPQAGMGAVAVANGEPQASFAYFTRAQQLGAPVATFGADRGLAYDLLGQQTQAQADYRAALGGADSDEARRRLALSLAISGNKAEAVQTLAPLAAKGDAATNRIRAFVLALCGDPQGAMIATDAAMPGSWSTVSPFLQRLPALTAGQKAAAVNLGIFPDSSGGSYAIASTATSADRLGGVEEVLRTQPPAVSAPTPMVTPSWTGQATRQLASASLPQRAAPPRSSVTVGANKVWLQLASGRNPDALPAEFQKIKSKNRDLFDGIRGYVATSAERSRLVIGPFHGATDAEIFANDLETIGIDAFRWTNSESDKIVPLGTR